MKYLFPLSPYNQQRQYQKPVWVYPAHLAMYATYLRNQGHEVIWGNFNGSQVDKVIFELQGHIYQLKDGKQITIGEKFDKIIRDDFDIDVPFDQLPFPDREFTDAKNPRWQKYGNYKYHPATHMMASNLCWWGRCTFCVDTLKLESGEKRGLRTVDHCLEEIDDLIAHGYKEAFDDSGTFPIGDWLDEFCTKMIKSGRNKKIVIGCNMKPISERVVPFKLMKSAGFRFILVGIESANQGTIDRIRKGQDSAKVIENMKAMNDAGLEVHLTSMFGYPWESHEDNMRTVNEIHYLLKKGYVKTAQASVYQPPRTAPPENHEAQKYIKMVYDAYKKPWYWWRKIKDIKDINDLTYLLTRINHLWSAK